jgi:hypothetical protein
MSGLLNVRALYRIYILLCSFFSRTPGFVFTRDLFVSIRVITIWELFFGWACVFF